MNPVADIFEAFACLPDIEVVTATNIAALNMQQRPCQAVQSSSRKKCTAKSKKNYDLPSEKHL